MAGGAKRGITNPWLLEESEETRGLGFDELRQQQRRIIEEQDAGLDALSSIISRQKQMGQEIGNELDEQNDRQGTEPDVQHELGPPGKDTWWGSWVKDRSERKMTFIAGDHRTFERERLRIRV
ncbi:hypothetical protein TURU_062494 [Turdus rufiventris]|nr:hypothetical protein TURU_062494 [Turdus rufiventris]